MKFEDMSLASVQQGDAKAMIDAIEELNSHGIQPRRPDGNSFQLKVSPTVSYYPTTKRTVPDARPALPQKGLAALIRAIENGLE